MSGTQAKCRKTKSYTSYGSKKVIIEFMEGKTYPVVNMGSSNIIFVIDESGYKQKFTLDFYTYFSKTV